METPKQTKVKWWLVLGFFVAIALFIGNHEHKKYIIQQKNKPEQEALKSVARNSEEKSINSAIEVISEALNMSKKESRKMVEELGRATGQREWAAWDMAGIAKWGTEQGGPELGMEAVRAFAKLTTDLMRIYSLLGWQALRQAFWTTDIYEAFQTLPLAGRMTMEDAARVSLTGTRIGMHPYFRERAVGFGLMPGGGWNQAYMLGAQALARPGGEMEALMLRPFGAGFTTRAIMRKIKDVFFGNEVPEAMDVEERNRRTSMAATSAFQMLRTQGHDVTRRDVLMMMMGTKTTTEASKDIEELIEAISEPITLKHHLTFSEFEQIGRLRRGGPPGEILPKIESPISLEIARTTKEFQPYIRRTIEEMFAEGWGKADIEGFIEQAREAQADIRKLEGEFKERYLEYAFGEEPDLIDKLPDIAHYLRIAWEERKTTKEEEQRDNHLNSSGQGK